MKGFIKLFLIGFLFFDCSAAKAEERKNIKLGFVLPLSGEWAYLGNGIRNGALLAKEDFTAAKNDYAFIFEDNIGLQSHSLTVTNKLINVRKVNALISIFSGVGKLINPLAEKSKTIHIGICSDIEVARGEYNFTHYITAEQGVDKFVERAITIKKTKPLKIGILTANEAGFVSLVDRLKQKIADIRINHIEQFDPNERDLKTVVLRTISKKPDILLLLALSPQLEIIARQLKEFNSKIQLASIEAFGLAADKSLFKGSWYVDAASPDKKFTDRYLNRFNTSVTPGVGHAYDTVRLMMEKFESTDETLVWRAILENKPYSGIIGEVKIDKGGIMKTVPLVKTID